MDSTKKLRISSLILADLHLLRSCSTAMEKLKLGWVSTTTFLSILREVSTISRPSQSKSIFLLTQHIRHEFHSEKFHEAKY